MANVVATSISTRAMSFPAAAAIGALAYGITQLFGDGVVGPLVIAAAGAAMIALAFAHRIRQGTPVPAG